MNARAELTPLDSYEPVSFREWSYVMSAEDFPDGCAIRTDAVSGRQWAFGRNKLGLMIGAPLGVPLCQGCDAPITGALCTSCNLVFLENGE